MRYNSPAIELKDGRARTSSRSQSPRKRSHRKSFLTCFNIFLALAIFEAVLLLIVGFFSDHDSLSTWTNPLENFIISSYSTNDENDDLIEMEEHLAKRTEKRLASEQYGPDDDELSAGTPLDDYYSRKHISDPVPVIVGGTDGSGTRAFVDVLAQLGVPMLVDDQGTMDVHAEDMFDKQGWPPLARMVLQEKHSLNYEVESLSTETRKKALSELRELTKGYNRRYKRLMRRASTAEGDVRVASKVTYGYKAPVSMIIVPLLRYVNKRMKYIHVVRDGRDVALSSNQSPVKKFYNDSFSDADNQWSKYMHTEMAPVLGMQLWNDWNTDLLEWEHAHADGMHFDFLVMRTEDLLNPEKKFESLLQLADFLGSPRSLEELCCLSQKAVTDMGMSEQNGQRGHFGAGMMNRFQQMRQNSGARGGVGGASQWLRNRLMNDRSQGDMATGTWTESRGGFFSHGQSSTGDFLSKAKDQEANERTERFKEIARRVAERTRQKREAALNPNDIMGAVKRRRRRRLSSFGRQRDADFVPDGRPSNSNHMLLGVPGAMLRPRHSMTLNGGKKANNLFAAMKKNVLQDSRFSSIVADRDAPSVNERYGKWARILEEKPEVAAQLHVEGSKGLAAFGYEPRARFMDREAQRNGFHCDDRVVCGDTSNN